jgi:AmmeMemoRadiSam system protein A
VLELARRQLEAHVRGDPTIEVDESTLSEDLLRHAPCFVTLTKNGQLRGCILDRFEAHEPIYRNVLRNVVLAASSDYRFTPVMPEELSQIVIEISVLGPPFPLEYETPDALLEALVPGEDGVILTTEVGTSTYLPQVWAQLPDPHEFLSTLCQKHGASPDCWRRPPYPKVEIYRVLHFSEGELGD